MCDGPVRWGTMRKNGEKISVLTVSPCLPHKVPMSYPYLFSSVLTVPGTVFYLNWFIGFIETKFLFMFPCIATTPMLATYSQKCQPGKETSTEFGSCIFHPVQFWRTDSQKHSLNKWFTWRYTVELKERKELSSLHYLPYRLSFLFYIFHSHFTAFTYQGFSS